MCRKSLIGTDAFLVWYATTCSCFWYKTRIILLQKIIEDDKSDAQKTKNRLSHMNNFVRNLLDCEAGYENLWLIFGAKIQIFHLEIKRTVRNVQFLSKNSTLISRENCRFFGWKTRENVVVLDILAVDNFDFEIKKCQRKCWVKNSWKCWGFVKIEFLDKNLTFRIVCDSESTFTYKVKYLNFRAKNQSKIFISCFTIQ